MSRNGRVVAPRVRRVGAPRRAVPAEAIEKVHPVSSPAASTPATDGQHVYACFGSYGVLASATGQTVLDRQRLGALGPYLRATGQR